MSTAHHIGQYRILRKLGAGGMGTVYLAEHILLGRRAAIKTLLPALAVYPEIVERFFTEARATSAIGDPGVVQVFDFGYHVDGTAYIVMELLEGEALSERLDRVHALPQADALKVARQVASALGAAHDKGIVHRDLKPENIYLVRDAEAQGGERTKILDFGICKLAGDGQLTEAGTTLGTPVYMAPEQCRGTGGVDRRTDIYALGCVLFHMLTGRTPFQCEGSGEYLVAHLQQQPPVPTELAPELHPLIDVLILRCLAKDPDERFQSMAELQDAIGQVMARISSPGITTGAAPATPVLGEGFRSGNGTTSEPPAKLTPPVADAWFVEMPSSAQTTTMAELAAVHGGRGWRRAAFAAIFAGAIVTALFATRAAIGDTTSTVPDVPPPLSQTSALAELGDATLSAPSAAIAHDTAPPPPPTEATIAQLPDAATWAHTVSRLSAGTVIAIAGVPETARPLRALVRPARRAVTSNDRETTEITPPGTTTSQAPKLQSPTSSPPEDLYDTR